MTSISKLSHHINYRFEDSIHCLNWINNTPGINDHQYQMLEHLGDAVLATIVTSYLFDKHYSLEVSARIKGHVLSNKILREIAIENHLPSFQKYSASRSPNELSKYVSDMLEALVGAVFIDSKRSLDKTSEVFLPLLLPYLNDIPEIDFKTTLNLLCHRNRIPTPEYNTIYLSGSYVAHCTAGAFNAQATSNTPIDAEQLAAQKLNHLLDS